MPKRHYRVIVGKVTLNNEQIIIFIYEISAWKTVAGSGHLYPLWVFLALVELNLGTDKIENASPCGLTLMWIVPFGISVSSGEWIRTTDLRVMRDFPGFGTFFTQAPHFSLA